MNKIFKLLERNPNDEITVDEFIQSYLLLEEKIRINNTKYEKALDELTEEISRNNEGLEKMEDEKEMENGLTDKSKLYITVIEAKDLISDNLIGGCNPFVSLSFQDDTQETKIKNNTSNPTWYEAFKFRITVPSGVLKVEVFDNTFIGKKSIGLLSIDLSDLMDQKKKMQWYDLFNSNFKTCGKIFLKIQCIINFRHYYEGEIEIANKEMEIIQNAYNLTNNFVESMSTPFGVLFSDNLDALINSQQFKQVDDLIKILDKNKESIYQRKDNTYNDGSTRLRSVNKTGKLINTLTRVLIYCFLILSLISLLERSDYLNLFFAFIIFYFFILDKTGQILESLGIFVLLFSCALGLDLIWLIINFGSFFIGDSKDPESGIKRFIYTIGICNVGIKLYLVFVFLSLRKKKFNYEMNE